jgi:hypothetical protein
MAQGARFALALRALAEHSLDYFMPKKERSPIKKGTWTLDFQTRRSAHQCDALPIRTGLIALHPGLWP